MRASQLWCQDESGGSLCRLPIMEGLEHCIWGLGEKRLLTDKTLMERTGLNFDMGLESI